MTRPTITLDAKHYDSAISTLQEALGAPNCNAVQAGVALGMLLTLRAASVDRRADADTASPLTEHLEAYRAENHAMREAIARAGFRCDIDAEKRVTLYPTSDVLSICDAIKDAIARAGFRCVLDPAHAGRYVLQAQPTGAKSHGADDLPLWQQP
jgi:hypothetical protein